MELVRFTGSDDWSALYVDGVLDTVSDHYLVDERISTLVGVEEHQSDDFLRGGNRRSDVPHTLDQLQAYILEKESVQAYVTESESP